MMVLYSGMLGVDIHYVNLYITNRSKAMVKIKHYTASWCGPCRALKPVIHELVAENPGVVYETIDVDSNKEEAVSKGIRSIPVVIVERNGVESTRIVGAQPKSIYENAIK